MLDVMVNEVRSRLRNPETSIGVAVRDVLQEMRLEINDDTATELVSRGYDVLEERGEIEGLEVPEAMTAFASGQSLNEAVQWFSQDTISLLAAYGLFALVAEQDWF